MTLYRDRLTEQEFPISILLSATNKVWGTSQIDEWSSQQTDVGQPNG